MLDFPHYNRTNFKRNFLRSVIFQVKFPKNPLVLTKKKELSEILLPILQNCKEDQNNTIRIQNINNKTQILPQNEGLTGFTFASKDSFKALNITETAIIVSISGQVYKDFETFWNEFSARITEISQICEISEFKWISIRKINMIQFELNENGKPVEGLASIFNNALVNQYLTFPSKDYLNSGLSNFSLRKHGVNLNLTMGLIPSSGTNKDAILDIDLFCDNEKLSIRDLESKFIEINQEVFNIFHWSLQDQTIDSLNN